MASPAPRRWVPDGAPRFAVQILHGMAEHAGRYDALARRLTSTGCDVWAHDHRGHGTTARDASELGHFTWDRIVADAWRVHVAMADALPGVPRVIVAHSMGSFVAQTMMAQFADHVPRSAGIRGVVLCGTSGPPPWIARPGLWLAYLERLRVGARGHSPLLEHLAFGGHNRHLADAGDGGDGGTKVPPYVPPYVPRTKFDWLSRDEAEVDAYIADPWCGFPLGVQSWVDFIGGLLRLAKGDHEARLPRGLPVLLLAGGADPVSDRTRALVSLRQSFTRAGIVLTEHIYPGARHELFNETNRDEVVTDLRAWLNTIA